MPANLLVAYRGLIAGMARSYRGVNRMGEYVSPPAQRQLAASLNKQKGGHSRPPCLLFCRAGGPMQSATS